jgi:hypothetical protein
LRRRRGCCSLWLWERPVGHGRLPGRKVDSLDPAVCPLSDQAGETVQHILVACVFSRQVWAVILHKLGLGSLAPQPSVNNFSGWWCKAIKGLPKDTKKGLNSLIILGAWEIWKHRNHRVFEGGSPCIQFVLQNVREECGLWCSAGARGLSRLLSSSLVLS